MKRVLPILFLLTAVPVGAQQQFGGLCARVKIEIRQELALERIGFEATLEVTNNDEQDAITDFFAELTFANPLLSTNGAVNDASSSFYVRAPRLQGLNDLGGSGLIGPTETAVVKWFLIPKTAAGGTSPNGIRYQVGCRLSGKMRGVPIPADVLLALPDSIIVRPEPQLEITYFQPRDVQGDDPFTPDVESPIPFTLGVLVKNSGYGLAKKVKIDSQQPRIVENLQNLLLVAQLMGARVNDTPLESASLVVNLGDIPPGQTRKGAWDMITSLSGEFIEFKASYTHDPGLGGEDTAVIKSMAAHFIAHEVLNDQPGRDPLKDFLADTDRDEAMIPDALFESEGNVLPVNALTNATLTGSGLSYAITVNADRDGWGYVRLADPGQARWQIQRVVRSDGKVINLNNVWTNIRYRRTTNERLAFLNLLDDVALGSYRYDLTYAPAPFDATPPVTTLHFVGTVTRLDNTYYVTPETQMYFLAEDTSPVSIFYSLTNGPFLPALPFRLRTPGAYDLRYYAVDASHNLEPTNQTTLVLSDDAPAVASAAIDEPFIVAAGDALSVRPAFTHLTFQAGASPVRVDAEIDVFRGVVGWATVRGVPSSPTRQDSASLAVAGENVDYYRYRLDGGVWSPERKVAELIALTALPVGAHTVAVLGRSAHGDYLAATNAIQVGWMIDAAAPPTEISGVPETPTRSRSAALTVGGVGVTDYRWNLNESYYRAESPTATPLVLTQLTGATQVVAVVGKTNGVFQPTNNPTLVTWRIDPGYGGDCSSLTQVRSVTLTNVGVGVHSFTWDARADDGTLQPPGWYTIKLTLRDELGRFSFATRLVHIGELSGAPTSVAEFGRGACRPDARRSWAVWQDQSDGDFEIYALNLSRAGNSPVALTSGLLSQENPRTDGRYVVWQSRQPNGSWDIWLADLASAEAPRALTATPALDEITPAVDWPWVVYAVKRTANAALPWQLYAHNLVTHLTKAVDPGPQDQLDPAVQAGRVVWQDHRDVGFGEIYFKDLETGAGQRLTTNTFGQYFPAIDGSWIVWQDNRHGQVELYGFDLLRQIEVRLTDSPENEARPHLEGPWLVCEEDSLGVLTSNLRLVHLPSLRAVPLTRTATLKTRGSFAGGYAVWQEETAGSTRILAAPLPALQGVFANQNAVPITSLMASEQQDAFSLLRLWHAQAGVQEITRFTSLLPQVVSQSARWMNGQPAGDNFALSAGAFLWIRFENRHMLDLGPTEDTAVDLAAGLNVLSYLRFPSGYRAFALLRQLGLDRVTAVRMLDAESGRWVVAQVQNGAIVGEDFAIPNVAVVWVDLLAPVPAFRPQ